MIMPISSDPLNLENVERKGKNYKKNKHLENKKSFLDEIKRIFHNILNAFF